MFFCYGKLGTHGNALRRTEPLPGSSPSQPQLRGMPGPPMTLDKSSSLPGAAVRWGSPGCLGKPPAKPVPPALRGLSQAHRVTEMVSGQTCSEQPTSPWSSQAVLGPGQEGPGRGRALGPRAWLSSAPLGWGGNLRARKHSHFVCVGDTLPAHLGPQGASWSWPSPKSGGR